MTREKAKQLLPVLQAFAEGKTVQQRYGNHPWGDNCTPTWDNEMEYRIKPEPLEVWGLVIPDGKVVNVTSSEETVRAWKAQGYTATKFREIL